MSDPFRIQDAEASMEALNQIEPQSTFDEAMDASFDLSAEETPVASMNALIEMGEAEKKGGELISHEELNELFPEASKPFTEPKTMAVAELIIDRDKKRQRLAKTIANGPQGAFYGASRFAGMLLPHALDPINVGLGILTAGAFPLVFTASRFPRVAKIMGTAAGIEATVGQTFIRSSAEGLIGSALAEPLVIAASVEDGREYGVEDAFLNTVGGALAIPGIALGARKARPLIKQGFEFSINKTAEWASAINTKYGKSIQRSSIARLLQDKRPRADLMLEDMIKETDGSHPSWAGTSKYLYNKIGSANRGLRVYGVTDNKNVSFEEAVTQIVDDFMGEGVYLTDSPIVANGLGARKAFDIVGDIHQLDIADDLKLVDLDSQIDDAFKEKFAEFMDLPEGMTGREAYQALFEKIHADQVRGSAIEEVNQKFADEGFDGLAHSSGEVQGVKHSNHNSMMLFDSKKVNPRGVIEPDQKAVGGVDAKVIENAQKNSGNGIDEFGSDDPMRDISEVNKLIDNPDEPITLRDIQAEEQAFLEELDSMESQGLLNDAEIDELSAIRAAEQDAELQDQIFKGAVACLGAS